MTNDQTEQQPVSRRAVGRRARHAVDQLAIRAAEHDEAAAHARRQRAELDLDAALDERAAAIVAAEDAAEDAAHEHGHPTRPAGLRAWFADRQIMLASGSITLACLGAEVYGQIAYYGSVHGLPFEIAWILSLGVGGASWQQGLMGARAAAMSRSTGKYTRRMWGLALIAGVIGGTRAALLFGNAAVGLAIGGASLLGPFAWHTYVGWTHAKATGRAWDELRRLVLARFWHPVIYLRSVRYGTLLQCDAATAWRYAVAFRGDQLYRKTALAWRRELAAAPLPLGGPALSAGRPPTRPTRPPTGKPARRPAMVVDAPNASVIPIAARGHGERAYGEGRQAVIDTWVAARVAHELDGVEMPSGREIDRRAGTSLGFATNNVLKPQWIEETGNALADEAIAREIARRSGADTQTAQSG